MVSSLAGWSPEDHWHTCTCHPLEQGMSLRQHSAWHMESVLHEWW